MMKQWGLSWAILGMLTSFSAADDQKTVEPKAANGDAPLPEGFPDATKPGTIEIKHYPAYRGAVARGKGMTGRSSDSLFWPLFVHISKNKVAMTAPVISTYQAPEMLKDPSTRGEVAMEFPYQRGDIGQVGPGTGTVEVIDHPPVTVVALGIQGEMNEARMKEGVTRLREWLDAHSSEWVADGSPRRLGYHGPMTPTAQRLWEIQLPVKPVCKDAAPSKP